jgi:hypothetical protein
MFWYVSIQLNEFPSAFSFSAISQLFCCLTYPGGLTHSLPLHMPVCRFFVRGNCKYGDKCRFEHPEEKRSTPKPSQNQPATSTTLQPIDILKDDLVTCLPTYHYSAYGNQISGYANLIIGDISPEELRFRAYQEGRETGALHRYTASVAQLDQYYREERAKLLQQQQPVMKEVEVQKQVPLSLARVFPLPTSERDLRAFQMDLFPAFGIPELPPAPEFCE